MELFDIGVNLAHRSFDADRDAVLARAQTAGISRIAVTGVNLDGSRAAADLAKSAPGILFSTAGVHPHYASDFTAETATGLAELLEQPGVVAVGECGLDFNRNFSERADQERAFEAQLELASQTGMPLFMHERDAGEAMLAILKRRRSSFSRGVIHCFTGDRQTLMGYLDLDLHIGITGWICDERRGLGLRELVGEIPPDRLLLETDAPFLMPRNIRPKPKGKRNEPHHLVHVLAMVAESVERSPAAVAAESTGAALKFFGIAEE